MRSKFPWKNFRAAVLLLRQEMKPLSGPIQKKINKNNCQAYGGTIGLDGRQQCARARAKTLNAQARPGR